MPNTLPRLLSIGTNGSPRTIEVAFFDGTRGAAEVIRNIGKQTGLGMVMPVLVTAYWPPAAASNNSAGKVSIWIGAAKNNARTRDVFAGTWIIFDPCGVDAFEFLSREEFKRRFGE